MITVDYSDFNKRLQATLTNVGRGTKKATVEATRRVYRESLAEVPRATNTLANSAFWTVTGTRMNWTGTVGYGGNGDPINPKTGQRASDYMVVVHEDLEARHPIGKAKFLEDPMRRNAERIIQDTARIVGNELKRG